MKPYRNLRGDSGVSAYEYGPDWIRVQFRHGEIYEYRRDRVGAAQLAEMKRLADAHHGLTTFINTHPAVKQGYTRVGHRAAARGRK